MAICNKYIVIKAKLRFTQFVLFPQGLLQRPGSASAIKLKESKWTDTKITDHEDGSSHESVETIDVL